MTSSGVIYRQYLALLHECETICNVYFFSTLLASTFVDYFGPTCACVTMLGFFLFLTIIVLLSALVFCSFTLNFLYIAMLVIETY